jgi:hypothetical protein
MLNEIQDGGLALAPAAVEADDKAATIFAGGERGDDAVREGLPAEAVLRWVRQRTIRMEGLTGCRRVIGQRLVGA